jgi:branched-chain amino acid transport system permease protein
MTTSTAKTGGYTGIDLNADRNRNSTLGAVALAILGLVWANGHLDGYQMQLLNLVAINAILAVSLNFIYGFAGMFSLGHAGFMAIGAYVSALCILTPDQKDMIWLLEPIWGPLNTVHTSFFVSVLLGGLAAALCGFLIAFPVMRLGGDYLGIATLGFAEIIRVLFTNWPALTNGAIGLRGIPAYANLWWNYAWLGLTLFVILAILKSNFGNVLKSIRDDEIAAQTMGINTTAYRTMAFCLGAFFAGVGGALMGSLVTTIQPKMFNFLLTFNIMMIVVAGGLGSITGSLVGAAVVTLMLEWLRIIEYPIDVNMTYLMGHAWLQVLITALALAALWFSFRQVRKSGRGLSMKKALWSLPIVFCGLILAGFVLRWLNADILPAEFTIPGIPGMRMLLFSVALILIIIFRRQGMMGSREFSWNAFYRFFRVPEKQKNIPMAKGAAMEISGVTMRFGGVTAIDNLSMTIPEKKVVGLIGPNGAGKTTVFNVITGFYRPQEGRVVFQGLPMTQLEPRTVCAVGVARTFQNIRLFAGGTVLENVMTGCHVRQDSRWWMAPLRLPMFHKEENEIRRKSYALLARLGLAELADEKAASLPYGAQRRLEIARALATDPSFLLLDEPAAGMNPQESGELMRFIEKVRDEFDLTILMIEHDMKVVMGVCSHIWVLEYGRLIAEGGPDDIRSNPKVISAYLGHQATETA